jgi:hypothetical protein
LCDGFQDGLDFASIRLTSWQVVFKDIGILPYDISVIFVCVAAPTFHLISSDSRGKSGWLVLIFIEAKQKVGIHGSVSVSAGCFEFVGTGEGGSAFRGLVYWVVFPGVFPSFFLVVGGTCG